jgi:hypothetical protein
MRFSEHEGQYEPSHMVYYLHQLETLPLAELWLQNSQGSLEEGLLRVGQDTLRHLQPRLLAHYTSFLLQTVPKGTDTTFPLS